MRRTGDDGDGDDTRGIEMATAPEGLKRGRSKRRPIFRFSLFSPLRRRPYLEVNTSKYLDDSRCIIHRVVDGLRRSWERMAGMSGNV
jgi:hypothetical protein